MKKAIIIIFFLICFTGCYRMSYKVTLDQGKTYRNDYWNNYFLFGLVPVKQRYELAELCPNGSLSRLETRFEAVNVVSALFSSGLSGANTLSAQCIAAGSGNIK